MCGVLFSISDNYSFEEYFHSALLNTHHRGPDNINLINTILITSKVCSNRLNIVDNDKNQICPSL